MNNKYEFTCSAQLRLLAALVAFCMPACERSLRGPDEGDMTRDLVGRQFNYPAWTVKIPEAGIKDLRVLDRRTDSSARTERIRVEVTLLAPERLRGEVALLYKHYDQGWRLETVDPVDESWCSLVPLLVHPNNEALLPEVVSGKTQLPAGYYVETRPDKRGDLTDEHKVLAARSRLVDPLPVERLFAIPKPIKEILTDRSAQEKIDAWTKGNGVLHVVRVIDAPQLSGADAEVDFSGFRTRDGEVLDGRGGAGFVKDTHGRWSLVRVQLGFHRWTVNE